MAIHRRTIFALILIAIIICLAAALLASIFVNPDRYRPQVIAYLEAKTGKQIEIGHIAVVWLPLSIRLDDFGTRNPKPFPGGYFLKAKSVQAAIDARALLHRNVVIKSLALYAPVIDVVSDPDGLWNFENPPVKNSRKSPPIFAIGIIPQVQITGGTVLGSSLIDPSDRPGPIVFEARNVNATLRNVDFNAFSELASPSAKPASSPVATGSMRADSLRLGSIEVTNFKAQLRLLTKQVSFDDVSVTADRGRATGDLAFNLAGTTPHFTTNVKLSGLDVSRLLSAFPAAQGKITGTMEGQVALNGAIEHTPSPLEGIRGNGNLTVRNGELPSLSNNDNFKKMTQFRDPADAARPASAFSSFSSDIGLANQRIAGKQINIAFYGVDIECAGDLGLANGGSLDFQGDAKILKKQGFFTNVFAKMFHEAKEENGKLYFPIRISGTILNPKVTVTE